MQTLWARAAQVRGSCCCPQCLSSVNGVSRRATGTATRRMPRYLTSSTLWFSGIFATAATFDAATKMRRREQWDVAIEGMKHELQYVDTAALQLSTKEGQGRFGEDTLSVQPLDVMDESRMLDAESAVRIGLRKNAEREEVQPSHTGSPSCPVEHEGQLVKSDKDLNRPQPLAATTRIVKEDDGEGQTTTTAFQPFSGEVEERDIFRNVKQGRPRPYWPANTGRALNVYRLPPQSIFTTDDRKDQWLRTTQVPKKVAATQMAVEMLQLTLFLELQNRGWSEEAARAVPEGFARNILLDQAQQLRRTETKRSAWCGLLRADGYLEGHVPRRDDVSFCNFTQDGSRSARKSLYKLDQSFRELFDLHANRELSGPALFAKIAYNLSISPAAPNVTTFNTLLLGFSHLGDRAITDPLIAYIRRAGVRMNEITIATVLRHYTKTNQPKNFSKWIKMMRGKNGGLMLARRDVPVNENSEGRLVPHENDPTKVVQLPYPTPYVFKAVIEGVMKFSGFDMALTICQRMGTDGWGLCIGGLTPLLRDCATRADWKSGWAIWKQIQALKLSSHRREGSTTMTERIKFPTFAAMLTLCSKCQKWDDFNVVWDEALKAQTGLAERLKEMIQQQQKEAEDAARREQAESKHLPEWHDNEDYFMVDAGVPDHPVSWRSVAGFKAGSSAHRLQESAEIIESGEQQGDRQEHLRTEFKEDVDVLGTWEDRAVDVLKDWLPKNDTTPLDPDQLHGRLSPGNDLDDYEIAERPWTLSSLPS